MARSPWSLRRQKTRLAHLGTSDWPGKASRSHGDLPQGMIELHTVHLPGLEGHLRTAGPTRKVQNARHIAPHAWITFGRGEKHGNTWEETKTVALPSTDIGSDSGVLKDELPLTELFMLQENKSTSSVSSSQDALGPPLF